MMEIYENDDCVFNLNEHFDLALELTKLAVNSGYMKSTILDTYNWFQHELSPEVCRAGCEEAKDE